MLWMTDSQQKKMEQASKNKKILKKNFAFPKNGASEEATIFFSKKQISRKKFNHGEIGVANPTSMKLIWCGLKMDILKSVPQFLTLANLHEVATKTTEVQKTRQDSVTRSQAGSASGRRHTCWPDSQPTIPQPLQFAVCGTGVDLMLV